MKKTYTLIYNPHAGKNGATVAADRIAKRIIAAGYQVQKAPTTRPGDATALALAAQSEVVVAIGGDGTINQVVAGLVKRQHPPLLGIIPQGTVNNLAKVLHIPLLPALAVDDLLNGRPQPLDVGLVNDRVMISTLALGVLANAAVSVTQQAKQRLGPVVYLTHGMQSLAKKQHWQLKITGGGQTWEQDAAFLLVTMTNSVGGFRNFAPQARPDDGLFHVFVAPRLTWQKTLLLAPYFLTGNFSKLPGMTYLQASALTITSADARLRSRIDGDPSVRLPLHLQVVPDKVQVLTKPQLTERLADAAGKLGPHLGSTSGH
ncbi:diacylglycerol/lipid kinase family protein [Lacticaseibacillus baoqingensis]|uniref:Diacylglycerol/lipid kinase family protein n=1 Tax=Lacticaseibacillus baoqingensis TaxID=2486013 RepID=A0ABW4E6U6_9LACO|nr:diacylglycerol kinase family protein [Lacticaseibacillus baoqingensis]